MKILNAMLGQRQGGIEQALIDYSEALQLAGHEVHALIHPEAAIAAELKARGIAFFTLDNWGKWDPFAILRLKKILATLRPDAAIAHGNRSLSLLRSAGTTNLIAPMHNYSIKCSGLAAVFCPTQDLVTCVEEKGVKRERIYFIPNLVRVPVLPKERKRHAPPVIGSMGRFVAKKGFDLFIEALAILKSHNIAFQAILAGDGEEAADLKALAAKHGLGDHLRFFGWAADKQIFFNSIDFFCLPSHHEPFGIVLLEAMAQQLTVVATASEGPSEILRDGVDGVIMPSGDATALAGALAGLLKEPERARSLAESAYKRVKSEYDLPVISARLDKALREICGNTVS